MTLTQIVQQAHSLSKPYAVTDGSSFRLARVNPASTGRVRKTNKRAARAALQAGTDALATLQERLYAHGRWSLLLIFQAMDAAGKDSAIKHVMSGVNPQGCQVASFKAPSSEELSHDYLWRAVKRLPRRGHIGIFNRSYYEEVLIVRVHPELLVKQRLPPECEGRGLWKRRFREIRHFERYLTDNGTIVRKFFLHVSRKEQRERLLDRVNRPDKHWKVAAADVRERQHWDGYMAAYEEMIRATATPEAPWYAIPADNKWFTRIIVAAAIVDALASLPLEAPEVGQAQMKEVEAARALLEAE